MMSDALLSFEEYFQTVGDPRGLGRCANLLHAILFLEVAATTAGVDGPEDMEKFANQKIQWLKQFVGLAGGIPSHDTIGRVLGLRHAVGCHWLRDAGRSAVRWSRGDLLRAGSQTDPGESTTRSKTPRRKGELNRCVTRTGGEASLGSRGRQ